MWQQYYQKHKLYLVTHDVITQLAVQEVGCHEELQRYLSGDGELGDLSTAVSVADFVREVLTDLGEHMGSKNRTMS